MEKCGRMSTSKSLNGGCSEVSVVVSHSAGIGHKSC